LASKAWPVFYAVRVKIDQIYAFLSRVHVAMEKGCLVPEKTTRIPAIAKKAARTELSRIAVHHGYSTLGNFGGSPVHSTF